MTPGEIVHTLRLMAVGGLTLHLDAALAERLRRAADAAGADIDAYALSALDYAVPSIRDWSEDRAIAAETVRDGSGIPLADFLGHLEGFGHREA